MSMVSSMERSASHNYDTQSEARAEGMPKDERSHERLFRSVEITGGGVAGPALARFEGRHRGTGGNALRAAVLGASDGLITNLSLVMGVAGANLPGHTILFTGLAGMLAGALSMSIGEWLSVQSARELYTHQIAVEHQELLEMPEEEREELALIYEAQGIDYHPGFVLLSFSVIRYKKVSQRLVKSSIFQQLLQRPISTAQNLFYEQHYKFIKIS